MAGYSVKGIALTNIYRQILLRITEVINFHLQGRITRTLCDVEVIDYQKRRLRFYTITPPTTNSL